MGVAQHLVAAEAEDALERLADDRGTQVAHMHRLGHIGPAIVDQDPALGLDLGGAQAFVLGDFAHALGQDRIGHAHIDEAEARQLDGGEYRVLAQLGDHCGADLARIAANALSGSQGAVALEVGQIGAVAGGDAAQLHRQFG